MRVRRPAGGPIIKLTRLTTLTPGLLIALVLIWFSMRSPIVAVAPVASGVRRSLHIGTATTGLLTTIPVVCFGLGTPLVLLIVRRFGLDRAVLIMLAGVAAGVLVRSAGGLAVALLGTLILGLAITIGNVVMPVIIGRDFPGRVATMTAAYSASMNVGAMIATTVTAPLAGWIGWRLALAGWAAVAILGTAGWRAVAPNLARPGAGSPSTNPVADVAGPLSNPKPLWRRPLVIGMTLTFAGQSFSYYGITAWLPSLLSDELGKTASSAGVAASMFQLMAATGAFTVPGMVSAQFPARRMILVLAGAWLALPLGLALAPSLWPAWCASGGFAQGGMFTVIFSVLVARAVDLRDSRRMSATVQGLGYVAGATGPFVLGEAHSLSGGWMAPLVVVITALIIMTCAGLAAVGSGLHS